MSALDWFVQAIRGLAGKDLFPAGGVQLVEIAKQVAGAMESQCEISADGLMVPNIYDVWLSPGVYARLAGQRTALESALADYLVQAAGETGLRLDRRPRVRLAPAIGLGRHQVTVEARHESSTTKRRAADEPTARLLIGSGLSPRSAPEIWLVDPHSGGMVVVDHFPFALGRSLDNEFTIDDRRVSRHHAVIKEINGYAVLVDLDSSNGTFVNGQPIGQRTLADGDIISLGGYTIAVAFGARKSKRDP